MLRNVSQLHNFLITKYSINVKYKRRILAEMLALFRHGFMLQDQITDTFILCVLRVSHIDDGTFPHKASYANISLEVNSGRRAVRVTLAAVTQNPHSSVTSHIEIYFLFM